MVDIHCHIIPNVDDGAQSIEQSIEMAKAAAAEGIHTLIATPHHANGKYENPAKTVQKAVTKLNDILQEQQIPLQVLYGQEVRVYNRLIEDLDEQIVAPLYLSNYILLEFPSANVPDRIEELIYELRLLDMIPIIAHPERNREIYQRPQRLKELIDLGALSQVTSQSINGIFGKKIQKKTLDLCRRDLAHFIASDAHNTGTRPFGLGSAYGRVERTLGGDYSKYYQKNAQCVVHNQTIPSELPARNKKKWLLF